jgi:UDP-N-acetyl-D-glucosamine dehydrogenase
MKIAIIGLGYVGLPLGLRFAEAGVQVLGLDVDAAKAEAINGTRSYIQHIDESRISAVVRDQRLTASTDFSKVTEVEAVIICVPTPLNPYREPDISFVLESAKTIAPHLSPRKDQRPKLVVLESTTYPGTTDRELREVLEQGSGLQAGKGFHLAFSPEREDPGRTDHSVQTIPKVMGGYTDACLERCKDLYSQALENIHPVGSSRVAEATKLTENIFRSVNIALVNELKVVFEKLGINVWEVIDAAATKPFGYMPFYPGPGLGGHCIPIDPFYLTWKAREVGINTRFIELAGEMNDSMLEYTVGKVIEALNEQSKSVNGSRILVLGLAYKPNVDDMRESPSFHLMDRLSAQGGRIDYYDPHIPAIIPTRAHSHWAGKKSIPWEESVLRRYDAVLIATRHSCVNYHELAEWCHCIVDTRNAMRDIQTREGQVTMA